MLTLSIVLHVIAATIWVGGHLALVFIFIIPAFKDKNLEEVMVFEKKYEKVGMPSLVILVITGLYQAFHFIPDVTSWLDFSNHFSKHILLKLIMFLGIVMLALDMKLRIFKMDKKPFYSFVAHVITVTILSVLLLIAGLSFRLNIF